MSELSDALAPLVEAERSAAPSRTQLERRVPRHRRRRWLRGAGVLVVVGAVIAGIAGIAPGDKRAVRITNPASTTTTEKASTPKIVTDSALGWTVEAPAGWTVQHSQSVCNPGEVGIVVSLDPHAFAASEGNAGCFEGSTPARPGAVIVSLSRVASASASIPSTPLPLSLADLPPSASGPQTALIFEGGDELLLRVVLPAPGPAYVRHVVDQIVQSLRPISPSTARPLLGTPAIDLALPAVSGIAFDASDDVYLADRTLNRVIAVGPDGTVVHVIGNGQVGFSGDGGPAADAELNTPLGIAVDDGGNLYIADSFNNRVRRVTPDGIITTYAGSGLASVSSPDGEPANQTAMAPRDVLWDPVTKSLYIADETRVRRIGADGIVHTVAGTTDGRIGFEANPGGLATETAICNPSAIAISTDRSLWIAEDCDKHIARVGPDGRISPVPGYAFRLAAAPDGSVSAYFGRSAYIDRITPTADSPLIALETLKTPATSCGHYGGQGDDSAALAWHSDTLYFANPSMGRVCARRADGTIDTIVGG